MSIHEQSNLIKFCSKEMVILIVESSKKMRNLRELIMSQN